MAVGVPQNGWFILENPIKMDDLGVPLFSETSVSYGESFCEIRPHLVEHEHVRNARWHDRKTDSRIPGRNVGTKQTQRMDHVFVVFKFFK